MFAGLLWLALQNGWAAQACLRYRNPAPILCTDSLPIQRTALFASETPVRSACERVAGDRRRIYSLLAWNYRMLLQVDGVYGRGDLIFVKLLLINRSDKDYLVDSVRFVIRSNRQETGEEAVTPVYVYGDTKTIRAQNRDLCVFVLPKFVLSGKRHLDIDLFEKHGGRHLRLKMRKHPLLHARFV